MAPEHGAPEFHQPNIAASTAPEMGPSPAAKTAPTDSHISSRGAEYAILTISLWFSATTLAWLLSNLINGSHSFDYLVVPISVLITSLPVFAFLFVRLRRAEAVSPELKHDVSRVRWMHATQILAFLACLINVAAFVYVILQHFGSNNSTSIPKAAGSLVVILAIAGGTLAYYWADSHKKD